MVKVLSGRRPIVPDPLIVTRAAWGGWPTARPGGHRRLDGRTRLALGAPVLGPVGRRDGGVGGQVG